MVLVCTLILLPLSLAATISFLVGCISPGARDLALYRVNVTTLASELIALSANPNHTTSDLVHPSLPTHWYYGLSGVCDFFASEPEGVRQKTVPGVTKCRRAFLPKTNTLTILEDSLRANIPDDDDVSEARITTVLSAWESTLNDIPPSKLRDKESRVTSQIKAAAALAILTMIIDIANAGVALTGSGVVFAIGFVSTVLTVVAGACAILSMNGGMHGVVSSTGMATGSLFLLFLASLLKMPAILLLLLILGCLLSCITCCFCSPTQVVVVVL